MDLTSRCALRTKFLEAEGLVNGKEVVIVLDKSCNGNYTKALAVRLQGVIAIARSFRVGLCGSSSC